MKCMSFEVVKGNGREKMLFLANAPIYAGLGETIIVPARYAHNFYNVYKRYVTPTGDVERKSLKHNFYEVLKAKKVEAKKVETKAMTGDEATEDKPNSKKTKVQNKSMNSKRKARNKDNGPISKSER